MRKNDANTVGEDFNSPACLSLIVCVAFLLAFSATGILAQENNKVSEVRKLIVPTNLEKNFVPKSFALDKDTIIVGTERDRTRGYYIFERNVGGINNWGFVKKIMSDNKISFTGTVALSGNVAVFGIASTDYELNENVDIFQIRYRNKGGPNNWGLMRELSSSQFDYFFRDKLVIEGETVAINAKDKPYGDIDSIIIYSRNKGGLDNWGVVKKIRISDKERTPYLGNFAISENFLAAAVYEYKYKSDFARHGSIYIFERNLRGEDNWGFVKKITPLKYTYQEDYGFSVDISGDNIIFGSILSKDYVSTSGTLKLYNRHQGGRDNWGKVKILEPRKSPTSGFGGEISISGDSILTGIYDNAWYSTRFRGRAIVFSQHEGGHHFWGEQKKLYAWDNSENKYFGSHILVDGDTAIVSHWRGVPHVFDNFKAPLTDRAINVRIRPESARNEGALWRLSFQEGWRKSGSTVNGLEQGNYRIKYKPLHGWEKPKDHRVYVDSIERTNITATYKKIMNHGYLKVIIRPDSAVNKGARWKVIGKDRWYESKTVKKLPIGKVRIKLSEIDKDNQKPNVTYIRSAPQTVDIKPGETTVVKMFYSRNTVF